MSSGITSYDFNQNRFVIWAENEGDYGQISAAYRLAVDLYSRLDVLSKNICIVVPYLTNHLPFKKHIFTLLTATDPLPFATSDKIVRIHMSSEIAVDQELLKSTPVIHFGDDHFHTASHTPIPTIPYQSCSLGLSNSTNTGLLGLMINKNLETFCCSESAKIVERRLHNLKFLDHNLRARILSGLTIEQFGEVNSLYLGYAQVSWLFAYVRALALVHIASSKDMTIVFPIPYSEYLESCTQKGFSWEHSLKGCNIRNLHLSNYQIDGAIFELPEIIALNKEDDNTEHRNTKKIHIIFGAIPHLSMEVLWASSEPETVVQGKQSVAEAVSANKCFIYQPERGKFGMSEGLQQLVANLLPKKEIDKFLIVPQGEENLSDDFYTHFKNEREREFLYSTMLNDEICASYDYWPRMHAILRDTLYGRNNYQGLASIEKATPETIPLDTPVIISSEEMLSLKIKNRTNFSQLEVWKGSAFVYRKLGLDSYLIYRQIANSIPAIST